MDDKRSVSLHPDLLTSFQELMVKQFRALQSLVDISHKESELLVAGDAANLLPVVESKAEKQDHLSVLTDSLLMVIDELVVIDGIQSIGPLL